MKAAAADPWHAFSMRWVENRFIRYPVAVLAALAAADVMDLESSPWRFAVYAAVCLPIGIAVDVLEYRRSTAASTS